MYTSANRLPLRLSHAFTSSSLVLKHHTYPLDGTYHLLDQLHVFFFLCIQQYGTSVRFTLFNKIHRVCRKGQLHLLKDALHYDKDILNYSTTKGFTLLHEAVDADQPDVVQLLLLYGLNPDVRVKGGLTPLHMAVSKCQVGCVRALIENGADITVRDDQGQDAIAKAELRGKKYESVLKILRSKGERT